MASQSKLPQVDGASLALNIGSWVQQQLQSQQIQPVSKQPLKTAGGKSKWSKKTKSKARRSTDSSDSSKHSKLGNKVKKSGNVAKTEKAEWRPDGRTCGLCSFKDDQWCPLGLAKCPPVEEYMWWMHPPNKHGKIDGRFCGFCGKLYHAIGRPRKISITEWANEIGAEENGLDKHQIKIDLVVKKCIEQGCKKNARMDYDEMATVTIDLFKSRQVKIKRLGFRFLSDSEYLD